MLQRIFRECLQIVYPKRCPICDKIVLPKRNLICNDCESKLQIIKEPRCKKCSKPIEHAEVEYCFDCSNKTFHYSSGLAMWLYDEAMQHSIAAFKYKGKKEYSQYYVEQICKHYEQEIRRIAPEVLIPVPIHKSKRKQRGFNQAEVIALGIGHNLSIPVISDYLIRTKRTLPQKQLSNLERIQNLQDAFTINKRYYDNKKAIKSVMIVDDIYTTGSTVEACTRILQASGIAKVYFLCVCIGKGY